MNMLLASNIAKLHSIDSVRIDQLQQHVESLHSIDSIQIVQLQHSVESLQNLIDISNGVIGNEFASSNNYLSVISIGIGIISLILAVLGIGLGIYINSLYKKVQVAEKTITQKEQVIQELSRSVQETDEKITNDLQSIYNKLRKEELKANVQRLEIEPLDIKHYLSNLLGNDLDEGLFVFLHHAYIKLIATGKADQGAFFLETSYRNNYLLVFFQHFLFKSLLDADLRPDVIKFLKEGCSCAFERDIVKCTKDLCKALNEPDISNSVDILFEYLVAVNQSEYKALSAIKDILHSDLRDKSILRQAIDRTTAKDIYLELFDNKKNIDDER